MKFKIGDIVEGYSNIGIKVINGLITEAYNDICMVKWGHDNGRDFHHWCNCEDIRLVKVKRRSVII